MRKTQISHPPTCMKMGSLKFSIVWIKWQIEYGDYKEWYAGQVKRKKRARTLKQAKEQNDNHADQL